MHPRMLVVEAVVMLSYHVLVAQLFWALVAVLRTEVSLALGIEE